METLELLLADRVRALAVKFRKDAFKKAWDELDAAGGDITTGMEQWEINNPRADFIEEAFLELRQVAVQLRNLRSVG